MHTIEYASELDPLLDLSLPPDWLVAVIPNPGQLLGESDLPEDRLFDELLSGGDEIVATRLGFIYYRGVNPDRDAPTRDNQISVRYDLKKAQFELSSVLAETPVQTADAAATWVDDQFIAVETFVDTYLALIELAEDINGLGRTGVRGLVETFETLDAIRAADIDSLAAVPYVDEANATTLQTALEDVEAMGETDPTPLERELRAVEGPVILDRRTGPITGKLIPSDASEPKYRSDAFGDTEPADR